MSYTPKNANWQATMANSSPVTIASDQSAVVVDLWANNDVTVTSSTLPTGASTSANQTTIIGHLDWVEWLLTTIDADTGNLATIETNTDFGTVTGGGTETGALRVTIANNSTGVVSVDDNWSTLSIDDGGWIITVDGTVAATQSGTWNVTNISGTVSLPTGASTSANQTTIIWHLDGVEGILTTIDADTGSMLTALQIMDDWDNGASDGASVSWDVAHDTTDAGEPVKIWYKAYEHDGTAPQTAVAEWDRVNGIADLTGRQYVATEHPRYFHVSADYASAQTNTSVQASPWAWLALNITDIVISNWATTWNITLLNGSGGTVLFEIYPAVNGWVSISLKNPIKLSDATALCITSTSVTTHSVFISGFID